MKKFSEKIKLKLLSGFPGKMNFQVCDNPVSRHIPRPQTFTAQFGHPPNSV